MRPLSELLTFLSSEMKMTAVYQPAIIRYLLEHDGRATNAELAQVLSGYDRSVQQYFTGIVKRWPRQTLRDRKVISYTQRGGVWQLNFALDDAQQLAFAKILCEQKIREWLASHPEIGGPAVDASVRYRVLKAARGRCELCGISAKLTPIDIDHITPQAHADADGYVLRVGERMHKDDERNLQALCFRCNRAKRDTDTTDWRLRPQRLVRESNTIYRVAGEGQAHLTGLALQAALREELLVAHANVIDDESAHPLPTRIAALLDATLRLAAASGIDAVALQARVGG